MLNIRIIQDTFRIYNLFIFIEKIMLKYYSLRLCEGLSFIVLKIKIKRFIINYNFKF